MSLESLIPLLVILPLSGFAITAIIGRRLGKQAHWIPVLAIFAPSRPHDPVVLRDSYSTTRVIKEIETAK